MFDAELGFKATRAIQLLIPINACPQAEYSENVDIATGSAESAASGRLPFLYALEMAAPPIVLLRLFTFEENSKVYRRLVKATPGR
jgi:hypothetical protein